MMRMNKFKNRKGKNEKKKLLPDLRTRTSDFALRIVKLYVSLPKTPRRKFLENKFYVLAHLSARIIVKGTSCKSDADIVNKFESVLQELDETDYWLDLLV